MLNANYTATPAEFTTIIDEGNQRMRSAAKVLGLRFKMKEQMTAEEWKALSDRMLAYSGSANMVAGARRRDTSRHRQGRAAAAFKGSAVHVPPASLERYRPLPFVPAYSVRRSFGSIARARMLRLPRP